MLTHTFPEQTLPTRAVIMGAGGFVGAAIGRRLETRGVPVLALTRRQVDLLATGAAERLSGLLRADDAFVAVSAIAPVKTPAMLRDNLVMIEAMTEALKAQPVAHVLNIGSDAVFADSKGPLSENSCRAPGSLHGIMHLAREVMFAEAAGATPLATLRPTLIYGLDDPHNGYGPNRFRRLAAEGQDLVLFGEGEERRDHVWVEDVAELALRILLHRSHGSLNAATGTVISFRAAAEAIAKLSGRNPVIKGSPRSGPMPHDGYRPFDPQATADAFPDFTYMPPLDGFARVQAAAGENS
ncbi:MAG: NAD-dependent epimerase/dehydratase family protein [Rhodospirillales bacterium]